MCLAYTGVAGKYVSDRLLMAGVYV